jgi:nucleoid-associated protein YgaU
VLEGGRSRQQAAQRAVFRRRRLAALAVVTALVVAVFLLASSALAGGAGGGVPSPATGGSAAPVVHVVQPGDTLWSIAGKVAPGADVRLTVDRLVELNGGAPLEVGDRLVLP